MKFNPVRLFVLLALAQTAVWAQGPTGAAVQDASTSASEQRQGDPFFNKARLKAEIELAERANNKMKSEATRLAEITGQLRDSVADNSAMSEENARRLSNIEKLAKGVREKAAGGDDDEEAGELPKTFNEGVAALSELAKQLTDAVEKTSRFVTSAAVIDKTNRIIALTRYLRKRFFNQ
jgi:hypothetical protein